MFFFLLFGRAGDFFCCLDEVRVFFLLFGRGGMFLFAVWAEGVFLFCCLGGAGGAGRGGAFFFFFFCCLGGGQEFTHLPVCLARL